ncbi:MAG: hypothetical protein KUG78_21235 [Kangiellaceae bacterium]|nr:hypothetical protein [Kangiellaceae bacterium]
MVLTKKISLLASFLFCWQVAAAEINFSGFATIAGGVTFDEDESLEGYDDNFSFDNGSVLAIQASSDLGDGWGVTAQLLARGSEAWDVNAEWAYLSYDASDEWRLLFGRQRAPFYMYSDFLDVSYAYHWIKPPTGVYSLPFDVFDGIGSLYSSTLGEFDSTVHIAYGSNRDSGILLGEERDMDFSDFFSASWTVNRDWLTLRAGYARADLVIPFSEFDALFGGWRSTITFAGIADDIELVDDSGVFASAGFIIDYDDYLLVGEFSTLDPGNNFFPDQDSYYITFGKRIDSVLVHFTYGADDNTSDFSILDGVPAGVDPGLDFLLASTTGLLATVQEDSSYFIAGVRWEIADSVALKLEYTDYQDDDILGVDASLLQFALTTVF